MKKLSKEYLSRTVQERLVKAKEIVPREVLLWWQDKNRVFCYAADVLNMRYMVKYKTVARIKELDQELCLMIQKYEVLE